MQRMVSGGTEGMVRRLTADPLAGGPAAVRPCGGGGLGIRWTAAVVDRGSAGLRRWVARDPLACGGGCSGIRWPAAVVDRGSAGLRRWVQRLSMSWRGGLQSPVSSFGRPGIRPGARPWLQSQPLWYSQAVFRARRFQSRAAPWRTGLIRCRRTGDWRLETGDRPSTPLVEATRLPASGSRPATPSPAAPRLPAANLDPPHRRLRQRDSPPITPRRSPPPASAGCTRSTSPARRRR